MRSALIVALVFVTACVLMGMGNLGGVPEGEIPKTDEDIKAQVVDRSGVSTELSRFSMDGKVFVKGKRGNGDMNVLFRKIAEVSFSPLKGNEVPADLKLKSGSRLQLNLDKSSIFYGTTESGAYRISAGDVSRIVFHNR